MKLYGAGLIKSSFGSFSKIHHARASFGFFVESGIGDQDGDREFMATTSSSYGAWTCLKSTCVEITTASFGSGSPECRDGISWVATAAPLPTAAPPVVSLPKTILINNGFVGFFLQLGVRLSSSILNLEKNNRDGDSKILRTRNTREK